MLKRMKKIFLISILLIILPCLAFAKKSLTNGKMIKIVTTAYPQYDWVCNIVGTLANVEVIYLLESGVDIHNYQPSVYDITKILTSDLFVYTGGESDDWVKQVISSKSNKTNSKRIDLSLMEILKNHIKEEEIIEGMTLEEEHYELTSEDDEDTCEIDYDEHVWLSLKNAQIVVEEIGKKIIELDGVNSDFYNFNLKRYTNKLKKLDQDFQKLAGNNKPFVFADRFPFRYLFDDYGFKYYSAFLGCSSESEASFQTVIFLANKLDEIKSDTIFKIDGSSENVANAVKQSTKGKNQDIIILDSIQSVPKSKHKKGYSYYSAMVDNYTKMAEYLSK